MCTSRFNAFWCLQLDSDEENDENRFNGHSTTSPKNPAKRVKRKAEVKAETTLGNTKSHNVEIKKEEVKVEVGNDDDVEEHSDLVRNSVLVSSVTIAVAVVELFDVKNVFSTSLYWPYRPCHIYIAIMWKEAACS